MILSNTRESWGSVAETLHWSAVVPNLTGPNALLEARTKFVHEVVSKLLIAAILLHVAAALKHHFADKDAGLALETRYRTID